MIWTPAEAIVEAAAIATVKPISTDRSDLSVKKPRANKYVCVCPKKEIL